MDVVKNISLIKDFSTVAYSLYELLGRPDNQDIAKEFPSSIERYGSSVERTTEYLHMTEAACEPGVWQQFIAFAGERAVGVSVVRARDEFPVGVEPTWPNLSGFICNPFRGQGLGRLSILERLKVVDEQFSGNAWTKVKKQNSHSQRMVTHAGFVKIGEEGESHVYTYQSRS